MQNYLNNIDQRDKKVIQLFKDLGLPKNIAKTLVYISKNGGCRSVDIEQDTNQRQPEVNTATHELMKKGWITKFDFRKKRRGRPAQIYKLAYSIDEILKKIEKEKIREIENLKKDFLILKNLIDKKNQ